MPPTPISNLPVASNGTICSKDGISVVLTSSPCWLKFPFSSPTYSPASFNDWLTPTFRATGGESGAADCAGELETALEPAEAGGATWAGPPQAASARIRVTDIARQPRNLHI